MSDFQFPVGGDGAVVRIDLGRPNEGNSLTRDMMRTLARTIRDEALKPDTRVVVIEGSGAHFCKGRDGRGESSAGLKPYEIREQMMGAVLGVYAAINTAPVPVVARVHAPAIGFGAALAGGCDMTLVSDAASFCFSEIKHGIPPTLAMAAVLKKVPAKALAWLIFSADQVPASEAVGLGLASKVYSAATFARDTDAFLTELATRPRIVLETVKKFQQNAGDLSSAMASEYAGALLALVRS